MSGQMSDALVVATVPQALRLAAAVRDHDVTTAHDVLATHSPVALQALAVALAAMVPESACVDDVLALCSEEVRDRYSTDPEAWSDRECRRLHAAFRRAAAQHLPRSIRMEAGEREYRRRSHARRKYLQDVNARGVSVRAERSTADRAVS